MNTVGRIGSYIGRGVSSVSGTFHPFGGAVDIIVVEQPDGSLKSSPWYVRFGKFQGVLKVREKVVNITVNGVEANFHMYLDSRGQAYFIKELDLEDGDLLSFSSSSSGEDTDGQTSSKRPTKSKSCNYDAADSNSAIPIDVSGEDTLVRANSRRTGLLSMVFGRKSMKNNRSFEEDSIMRADSLERAEIAADLLEMKWSTNLTPKRYSRDYATQYSVQDTLKGAKDGELRINDGKSDTSSPTHDNMLDNLALGDPAREKDDFSHLSFQNLEEATRVSAVVQSVEDYSHEESLNFGDGDELGVVNADHDARGSILISDASSNSQVVDSPELEKHKSLKTGCLSKEQAQSVLYCETEENSIVVLDVSIEQVTPELYVSRGENLEASMHAQTVLSMNDLTSEGNTQEDLLVEKDPSNVQGFEKSGNCSEDLTNNSYSNLNTQMLVSESSSLDGSAVVAESGCILPVSCSSTSACEDRNQSTIMTDKASNKLEASLESVGDTRECNGSSFPLTVPSSETLEEEQLLFGDMDGCGDTTARFSESISSDYKETIVYPPASSGCPDRLNDYQVPNYASPPTLERSIHKNPPFVADTRKLKTVSSNVDIPTSGIVQDHEITRMAISLPNMPSNDNNLPSKPDDPNPSIILQKTEVPEVAEEVKNSSASPEIETDSNSINSSDRRWISWSFSLKRSRSMNKSGSSVEEDVNSEAKSISNNVGADRVKDAPRPKISKKKIMLTTPTAEQLATLNLKEGKNIVIFTFSTAMLGKQQVDARIYLWRWDSKIVISDVDGTITRSDVLGQFMPMVGRDWSQIGVARLFSAVKENGYQVLFLSARAISQAYLTRQFLFNLMQDGKGLPEGPVLTSPDGIFPSLFREVVRRVPHEFKIACLQDIKALFPPDKNPFPFYAGFGNRHTDEISYLKVGIPKGKIFTINPKGQIVVNCHIDTKSYTSLHNLVNGMFPAKSSCEQEDFNYWNYWKLPPSPVD